MKVLRKSLVVMLMALIVLFASSCEDKKESKPKVVGDVISFGGYQWVILAIEDNNALLLSNEILGRMDYHSTSIPITWENCSLRAFLNGDFYNTISAKDRERIIETTNVNANNQWFGTTGGATTQDNIFLLSLSEIVQYFGDSGQLANRPSDTTTWIEDQFSPGRIALYDGVPVHWWLRSPGEHPNQVTYVYWDGSISMAGMSAWTGGGYPGFRPALWLRAIN